MINKKDWCKNNPEKHKGNMKKYRQSPKGCYAGYIHNAKTRGYEFNLSLKEFITFWQKPCYYCGEEIKSIGLDRRDNTKGYFFYNIISCCEWCNKMKSKYTEKEFINKCKIIASKF